ncbi:hypothetical protein [Streptomyces sp. NPDC059134]|uniref:hypothetical protein n=1 Tax=Streptomyces sp. NPDC059134 TaxID=3346738 RepID=UPI003687504B
MLEFLLAHGTTVVTTNCLLSSSAVAVRTRPLVKPDSCELRRSVKQTRGLGPTHLALNKALRRQG